MQNDKFYSYIKEIGNDLETSITNLTDVIGIIYEDIQNLQEKTSKPDKSTAKALLEYLAMEDSKFKTNMEILCRREIQAYLNWLNNYCNENNLSQEQALNRIIESD